MIPRMLIFLLVFLAVYGGMHFYIYYRIHSLFSYSIVKWIIVAMAVLTPLSMFISRSFYSIFTRILQAISSTWLGVAFLMFVILLLYEGLRFVPGISQESWRMIIPAAIILLSVIAIINAQLLTVKRVELPLAYLDRPVRIVQLSDIHVGTIQNSGFLQRIVRITNEQNPDMVFITGDFFDGTGAVREHTLAPLNSLKAKVFFISGNHEVYEGYDKITDALKSTNVSFMDGKVETYKGLQIIGIGHPRQDEFSEPDLSGIDIDKGRPSVLLYHQPLGMEDANEKGIDLQLAGHTHNGQIFPFNFIVKLFYSKINGLYRIGDLYLYVSPGTGTWGPPMRLGSRNEITVIDLTGG
ncbi:MAG: metallophosphoesterase [archaeon]